MRRAAPFLAALLLAAQLLAPASPARAEAPNLSEDPTGTPGPVARLVLAQRTYQAALAQGDAVLLLAAIRLARSVASRRPTSWVKTPPETTDPDVDTAQDPAGPEALAILQGLASENPDLQDLVYDLDAQRPHDPQGTVAEARAALDGGQGDSWRMPLFGELPAEIALIGGEGSALSLTVADEGGTVVCALPPGTKAGLCGFTPARNGFFTVEVRNEGPDRTSYRLIGN